MRLAHCAPAATGAFILGLLLPACGSCPKPPAEPPPIASPEVAAKPVSTEAPDDANEPDTPANPPSSGATDAKSANGATNDPSFPENATVDQAIGAVPEGAARANLDPDRLAEPLQRQSVYTPCNIGSQHFKVRVAVWAGRAVGVDVTTPSKKLAACIDKQIRGLTWPDKIRSLNTVEFSF